MPPRAPVGVASVSYAPSPEVIGTGERCRLPRMNRPEKATTVTIIGAGLGGVALVANLGLLGYRLRLHDRDEARIARVRERGGLDVEGLAKGFAPLELVTPHLAPAVDGADVIVVVTGSHCLITLTSTMLRRDFRSEGRDLAQLGLAGKTVGEIRSVVETGPTG